MRDSLNDDNQFWLLNDGMHLLHQQSQKAGLMEAVNSRHKQRGHAKSVASRG